MTCSDPDARRVARSERIGVLLVVSDDASNLDARRYAGTGVVADLVLERLEGEGAALLFPDPAAMAGVTFTPEFEQSIVSAHTWARRSVAPSVAPPSSCDIRWRIARRDGEPLGGLTGGSAGGAFAVGLTSLFALDEPSESETELVRRLDLSGIAVTAQVTADGRLLPVQGVAEKLSAAAWALPPIYAVVVAAEQAAVPAEFAPVAGSAGRVLRDPTNLFFVVCARTVPEALELLSTLVRPEILSPPPLPRHYLERAGSLPALRKALIDKSSRAIGITGRAAVGLHGMGGIGKTVLAAALARDPGIRRAYPDGVFWLTLGREPDLLQLQGRLATIGGLGPAAFSTRTEAEKRLRTAFRGKSVLLVLDDAWEASHVNSLAVVERPGAILITTRNRTLLRGLEAAEHRLDVLPPDESLALLAAWAGEDLAGVDLARRVAERCGHLPLALAMLGAMRRAGNEWAELLERLSPERIEHVGRAFSDYPYANLVAAVEVSVEALGSVRLADSEANLRRRYLDLAVFPEDVAVPLPALATLWGTSETGARECVDKLVKRSLGSVDEDPQRLSIHDVQRDYVRLRARDLRELHTRLVESYRAKCVGGFPGGPDDGYFFQFLTHHLLAAGFEAELRGLLLDFDWMRAKLEATDANALIGDYEPFSDGSLRFLQSALLLSAHVLAGDKRQLAPQILGRSLGTAPADLDAFLERVRPATDCRWLRPLCPTLISPGGPLLATFTGHRSRITSLVDLGEHVVASLALDGSVRVLDLHERKTLLVAESETAPAHAIAPMGFHRLIAACADQTLRLWELDRPSRVRTVEIPDSGAFKPSETSGLGCLDDRTVVVLSRGRIRRDRLLGSTRVSSFQTTDAHELAVWDVETGKRMQQLILEPLMDSDVRPSLGDMLSEASGRTWLNDRVMLLSRRLSALSVFREGVVVVPWLSDMDKGRSFDSPPSLRKCALLVWDVTTGEHRVLGQGAYSWLGEDPENVRFGPQREVRGHLCLWVIGPSRRAGLLDLCDGRILHQLESGVLPLAYIDRSLLVSGPRSSIGFLDLDVGDSVTWEQGVAPLSAEILALSGSRVADVDDTNLRLWDLGKVSSRSQREVGGELTGVRILMFCGPEELLSIFDDGRLLLLDLANGRFARSSAARELGRESAVTFSGLLDVNHLVLATEDGRVKIWDLRSQDCVEVLEGQEGMIDEVVMWDDTHFVAAAGGQLWIWGWGRSRKIPPRVIHEGGWGNLRIIQERFLVAECPEALGVWDLVKGTRVRTEMRTAIPAEEEDTKRELRIGRCFRVSDESLDLDTSSGFDDHPEQDARSRRTVLSGGADAIGAVLDRPVVFRTMSPGRGAIVAVEAESRRLLAFRLESTTGAARELPGVPS